MNCRFSGELVRHPTNSSIEHAECPECAAIRKLLYHSWGDTFPAHQQLDSGTSRARDRWKRVNGSWQLFTKEQ